MDRTTFSEHSMTVQRLIEELQKLPQNALLQEVVVRQSYGALEIANVRWQGNCVALEPGNRYA